MRRYSAYKPSGVDWLGEIPIEWKVWKVSRLFKKIGSGTTPKSGTPEYYENGIIPWVNTGDLNDGFISDCSTYITQKAFDDHSTLKIYEAGTLLVAMYGATIGKIAITKFEACTNQACCSLVRSKLIDTKFAFYWFLANKENIINLSYGGGQPNISQDIIRSLKIPICNIPEQLSIVRFLDHKTGQIDRFITNRQKQIELLKEQLQKKIYTVLTKGLSNISFKRTNLPWFPEIPMNWDLYKFNAAVKLLHGFQFRDNHFKEVGVKVVKITQLKADGTLDLSEASLVDEKFLSNLKAKIIKNGDILMALTGGTIGKIIRVDSLDEEVLQNYRVGKFIPKDSKSLDKDFMFWVLSSEFTYAQIMFLQRETGQPNIGISDFSKMFFPLPDTLEEQMKISTYILEQKSETDSIVSKYQKQIDLMQEYRTSLISQAVTGKIDVRDWQPKKQKVLY